MRKRDYYSYSTGGLNNSQFGFPQEGYRVYKDLSNLNFTPIINNLCFVNYDYKFKGISKVIRNYRIKSNVVTINPYDEKKVFSFSNYLYGLIWIVVGVLCVYLIKRLSK